MNTSRNVSQRSVNEAINIPIGIYKQTSSPNSNHHDIHKEILQPFNLNAQRRTLQSVKKII